MKIKFKRCLLTLTFLSISLTSMHALAGKHSHQQGNVHIQKHKRIDGLRAKGFPPRPCRHSQIKHYYQHNYSQPVIIRNQLHSIPSHHQIIRSMPAPLPPIHHR